MQFECNQNKKLMINNKILPTFCIVSQRGQKTHCQICGVKFQVLLKQQHQCKRCLRSICQKCGPNRQIVYQSDNKGQLHRTCTVCVKENLIIKTHIEHFRLCFAQDCSLVEQWLKKLNKQRKSYQTIVNEYSDCMAATNQNIIRFKRQSQSILNELDNCYNYSFRHFVRVMLGNVSDQIFGNKVKNVVISIYAYLKNLPYIPELILIVIFFLCYASQAHSYFLITRLIEKVYPQYLRVKKMRKDNLLQNQLKVLIQMYKILCPKADRTEIQTIVQYLQGRFVAHIMTMSLNICEISTSFLIIDDMLKTGSYLVMYRGISSMLSICRQELSSFNSYAELQLTILRRVHLQDMKRIMIEFDKSEMKFQISHDVFDSAEHRKLFEKHKQMQELYQRSNEAIKSRDDKISSLSKQLAQSNQKLENLTHDLFELQEELLTYSQKIPIINKVQVLQAEARKSTAQNKKYKQQLKRIRDELEEAQLESHRRNHQASIADKMDQFYTQQLVKLKTANQIMEIQIAAKELDFNTSFIDSKIQQKNQTISQLEKTVKKLQVDLTFFQQKDLKNNFSKAISLFMQGNGSFIDKNKQNGNGHLNGQNAEGKSNLNSKTFQLQIQTSKKMIQSLKQKLQKSETTSKQLQAKVLQLQKKCKQQKAALDQSQSITSIVRQMKQQPGYEESIETLDRLIQKEDNFLKKSALNSVKEAFTKCLKQIKFRSIQLKIQQKKLLSLNEDGQSKDRQKAMWKQTYDMLEQLLKKKESQEQGLQSLQNWLKSIEETKTKQAVSNQNGPNKQQECIIM